MADSKDAGTAFVLGIVATAVFMAAMMSIFGNPTDRTHAELCPTILALSPTAADSLAVFQEHEGCFDFVQTEAP